MNAALNPADMMDIDELALVLGLKRESIRWYLCNKPERLPPRVAPLLSRKPVFSRAVVAAWLAHRDGMAELQARLAAPIGAPTPPVERPPRVAKRGRPRRVQQAA